MVAFYDGPVIANPKQHPQICNDFAQMQSREHNWKRDSSAMLCWGQAQNHQVHSTAAGVDSRAVALACFFDNLMLMIVTYPWNAMLLMEIGKQHVSVD